MKISWKWRCDEVIFYSYYKKYLLTNFTLQFLLLLCLHKWIFVKFQKNISSKIFIDFFSNNFSPVKICRLVQEKNCLFSTSKNLWIFLDLNFLTIFTQKMYLHAKRIFKVRKKFHRKNLLKNWEMSKNSKNFAMKKKNYHPKFLDFFAIFWWIFSLPNFCICMPKKKNELSKNVCQNSKIEEFNVELS